MVLSHWQAIVCFIGVMFWLRVRLFCQGKCGQGRYTRLSRPAALS